MEIQYPLHQHPLKLVSMGSEEDERACAGCDDRLSGEVYACDSCRLYLHQSCANLPPKIDHFIHPSCPLFLKLVPESRGGGGGGGGETTMMLWYQCEACNFGIDAACGQEKHRLLPPFSEHCSLLLRIAEEGDAKLKHCRVCNALISGNYYTEQEGFCREYYIHESCGGHLPRKIRHFYHPCTLSLNLSDGAACGACRHYVSDAFLYHCQNCDFSMDAMCTKFETKDKGEYVQHWCHHHPLQLSDEADDVIQVECQICRRTVSDLGDYAGCDPCQFYIHISCLGLPLEIQHRCHPHPLSLKPGFWNSCDICLNPTGIWHYMCDKCMFKMDVKCALFSQEDPLGCYDPEKHILHFCHHHPLQLFEDPKRNKTDMLTRKKLECPVCESSASGLTYACKDCDVYIHKSCLGVLTEILHKEDGSLFLNRRRGVTCVKCRNYFSGFNFCEDEYNQIRWCIPCVMEEVVSFRVSLSSIFIQLHFHPCPLTLKFFSIFTCNACFTHWHTHAYYCEQCNFYVGTKCARVSMESFEGGEQWILHFCHWHPLQLSQGMEDDSSASCKICATVCTLQPLYVCNECDSHIHSSCLDILPQKIEELFQLLFGFGNNSILQMWSLPKNELFNIGLSLYGEGF